MKKLIQQINPDYLGALSAGLCLIHCTLLPIAWLALNGSSHALDFFHGFEYLFLILGLFAVYHAVKVAASKATAIALIVVYSVMILSILVEALAHWHWHTPIYVASALLVVLHIINYRQCRRCAVHAK